MAQRPVFFTRDDPPFWNSISIEFKWHPGLSLSQKQQSIDSLHDAAMDLLPISRILEVSTKSPTQLGTQLSAFRLTVEHHEFGEIPLESAFQGSKIYQRHGPVGSALTLEPREAKALVNSINESDELVAFQWAGKTWPLEPKTWFYDWLYISAVQYSRPDSIPKIRRYDAFTDIEFNPAKSFNCQARSCAIIASTVDNDELMELVSNPELMLEVESPSSVNQLRLL